MQAFLTIFYLIWLVVVLTFIMLIYFSNRYYIRKMETTMIESRAISAQAALKSAEVAQRLVDLLERKYYQDS
jgi:uncharacterized protein (UPF0333 family)